MSANFSEEESLRTRERRDNNASVSVFDFLINRLTAIDKRIEGRYTGTIREENKMRQRLQFGSEAMSDMAKRISTIRDNLNAMFQLVSERRHGGDIHNQAV